MKNTTVIGICGGSGSGKTTLLNRMSHHFRHLNPSVFSMDNYYLPLEQQEKDENGVVNFDLPQALDEVELSNDLSSLIDGKSITTKEYHFNTRPENQRIITVHPSPLIIVEGLFLFHYQQVRKSIDFSIFIEVDERIQLDRRIHRDLATRGYSRSEILYQWVNHVLPCYHNYLLPYRNQADFVYRNESVELQDHDFDALTRQVTHRIGK